MRAQTVRRYTIAQPGFMRYAEDPFFHETSPYADTACRVVAPAWRVCSAVLQASVGTRPRLIGRRDSHHWQTHGDGWLACHGVEPGAVLRELSSHLEPCTLVASGREADLAAFVGHALCPEGEVVFGWDDTIERRRGEKSAAQGSYRDPVRASQAHCVQARGLRWLCWMLLVHVSPTHLYKSCPGVYGVGGWQSPAKQRVRLWGVKHRDNGAMWRLLGRHRFFWDCSRAWQGVHGLKTRCTHAHSRPRSPTEYHTFFCQHCSRMSLLPCTLAYARIFYVTENSQPVPCEQWMAKDGEIATKFQAFSGLRHLCSDTSSRLGGRHCNRGLHVYMKGKSPTAKHEPKEQVLWHTKKHWRL
jgi:hypothetical protein